MFGLEFTRSQIYGSNLELVGVITGILSVLLLLFTKNERLQWVNWPCSVVSAAIYFKLFREWHLYGNMALQVPFLIISVIGLWQWRGQLTGIVRDVPEIPTTYTTIQHWASSLVLALLAEIPAYFLLQHYGDLSPLWDGLIFTISIAAIYLQLKKYVQSWYLWIMVDAIAVPFHFSHQHGATGLLYFFYACMCIGGLLTWRKEAKEKPITGNFVGGNWFEGGVESLLQQTPINHVAGVTRTHTDKVPLTQESVGMTARFGEPTDDKDTIIGGFTPREKVTLIRPGLFTVSPEVEAEHQLRKE